MIPATAPVQRPPDARLLVVDAAGRLTHVPRSRILDFFRPGDLVVANDAATLPASLPGVHDPTGSAIEVRLAGRRSLAAEDVREFVAVVFGAGDFRTRTEDRPLPAPLAPGHSLTLGPLTAAVERLLDHPRLVVLRFDGSPREIWAGLARHGRPIQYAHMAQPLALWDVWTAVAAIPVAYEPPSAGFVLDWQLLRAMPVHGVGFATITLAAGISSTGDEALDRRLPLDEPYRIPPATADAIRAARARGGRIIAIGTSVVRALEHAAERGGRIRAGDGVATGRLGPGARLRCVDVIVSGTHEPGSSHYDLLRAFAGDAALARADAALARCGYRTHEFGDSVMVESRRVRPRRACRPAWRRPAVSAHRLGAPAPAAAAAG